MKIYFAEIKSFASPPKMVLKVVMLTLILLNKDVDKVSSKTKNDPYW